MNEKPIERLNQIIQFVKDHPFCSKDSIFRNGKIPKSKLTESVLEQLVSKQKIRVIHTENGKKRYYDQSYKSDLNLLKYGFRDCEYRLKEITKRHSALKPLVEMYATMFHLRIKVLEHEQKVLDSRPWNSENLNLKGTIELVQKIQSFIEDPGNAEKHYKYIKSEIERDRYYLEHELHSKPRLNRYPFQKEKFRHVRRQLSELYDMKVSGNRRGLTKADYEKNVKKLQSKSDFKYDEIFKRLVAEHNRTLYHNPEMTPNRVMIRVTNERLQEINRKHSLSKNYEYEKQVLEDWRDVITKIPMEELLTSPKYEEGIPTNLLSRFTKKRK